MPVIISNLETLTEEYATIQLDPFFDIYKEVWGIHSVTKKRKRIDSILIPKPILIKNNFPKIPVGLELKTFKPEDGNKKQIIEVCKQAIDYRHTRFKMQTGYNFLPLILIYPPSIHYLNNPPKIDGEYPSYDNQNFKKGFHYLLSRLLGKFFIGELIFENDNSEASNFIFKIILGGAQYYIFYKNHTGRRLKTNWGFEKYEEMKKSLIEKNLTSIDYEEEILKISHFLGI